jgi:PAS domain S-box-containing protein
LTINDNKTKEMKTILAIDDKKDNLITIKAVIQRNIPDCRVLTALSGEEGLRIAKEDQPDTILLDIIMPKMDGYEVCKRLKEDELTKHIPVVMVTAIKTDSKSRVKGLEKGADVFLSKPIDPVEFSAQVNVALRIKTAEDKLREEKINLESIVLDRTKELRAINEKLKLDIIERKKTERKLKNSAERFERWKSSNFIGIIQSNAKGDIIDTNDAFLKMLGYTNQDLTDGKLDWTKLTPPEFLELDIKAMEEAAEKGAWTPFEKEYFHKDGHRVPILIGGSVFMEAPDEYIVFIIDLTDRKQAEEELKKHKENLEELVNERTKELKEKNDELDNALKVFVGRELTIKNLQEKIKVLEGK